MQITYSFLTISISAHDQEHMGQMSTQVQTHSRPQSSSLLRMSVFSVEELWESLW